MYICKEGQTDKFEFGMRLIDDKITKFFTQTSCEMRVVLKEFASELHCKTQFIMDVSLLIPG